MEHSKHMDNVKNPGHYTQGDIECIDAIHAALGPEGFLSYCQGNVLKYIWRYKDKGGVQDLQKAQVYLRYMTEKLVQQNNEQPLDERR